jgi:hypothetical protein
MVRRIEAYGWALTMAALIALAVPWFRWGSGQVAFGLPLWLWWHIGWMGLASVTFYAFARRAWGIGIETDEADGVDGAGPGAEPVSERRAGPEGEV